MCNTHDLHTILHDDKIKVRHNAILEYLTIARREGFGTY